MKEGVSLNILRNPSVLNNFFYIYGSLFLLFLLQFFTGSEILSYITAAYTIVVLLISWVFGSRLFKIIGILFITAGTLLSISSGNSITAAASHITDNLPLLFFFSILPWIGTVVKVGGMDSSITDMIQDKTNRVEKIYGKSMFTSYFLAIFLNISALYIIQNVLWRLFKNEDDSLRNAFIIKSTLRAFALAVIWSPLEVIVGLTVDSTGTSYFTLLPWLVTTSLLVGLIEMFIATREFQGMTLDVHSEDIDSKVLIQTLFKMTVLLVSFLGAVMILNTWAPLDFIMTIAVIILPFSFTAAFIMRRFKLFLKTGWATWKDHNNHLQNFAILFLSLGIFAGGFNSSAAPSMMQEVFSYVDHLLVLILLLIMIVIYGLAMVGVHPVATLAILAEVLVPVLTPENSLSISLVMIVCGMGISPAAPYGINATMTAQSMGLNPYKITRMNIGFSIRMASIGILIAMLALVF